MKSDNSIDRNDKVIPTGSVLLDRALGVGGFPRGRIVEVYGPEASGKTTIALHAIAEVQKMGGHALFIDAEHALDMSLAEKVGVNVDELVVSQPDNGEQALSILEMGVTSGKFVIAVVDSVSALVPKAEIEGDMGSSHMGLQARLMSQAMRKLTGIVHTTDTLVIFINQLRQKIGVTWGPTETTTGGNALKFYASVRLDIRRIAALKDKENIIGNRVKVKIAKNKLAPPFKEIETDLIFGHGFNKEGELLDMAREYDIIDMKGSHYSFNGEAIANGKLAACETLRTNKTLYDALYAKVKEFGIKPVDSKKSVDEDTDYSEEVGEPDEN
jgi:recombination protein RecA